MSTIKDLIKKHVNFEMRATINEKFIDISNVRSIKSGIKVLIPKKIILFRRKIRYHHKNRRELAKLKKGDVDILFISHEDSMTGAPRIVYEIAKSCKDDYKIKYLSLTKGLMTELVKNTFDDVYNTDWIKSSVCENSREEEDEVFDKYIHKVLKKINPKLVYANSLGTFKYVIEAKKLCIPTIFHLHELGPAFISCRADNYLKEIEDSADKVVVVSEVCRRLMIDNFKFEPEKIELVNEFINSEEVKKKSETVNLDILRASLGINKDDFVVVGCGHASLRKGTDLFLKACEVVRRNNNNNIKLLWVGRTREFNDKIKEYDEILDIDKIFTGETMNPFPYINLADLFVLPSRSDPFPLVVLEAMSLGKPVLSIRNGGGSEEQLGENGIFIDEFDGEQLGDKIIELSMQNLTEIGASLKERQKDYDSKGNIEKVKKMIQEVIK